MEPAPPPRLARLPARALPGGLTIYEADTPLARLCGLMALDALPPDAGLHLTRCRSVHTLGMRFALDLIWLDAGGALVRVDEHVAPRRHRATRRARSVVEVGAGRAAAFLDAGLIPHSP
ncbi:MAG TPA: DUF192 domain-containing protein [Baekduia sp.]|nr:DUF192 domain-containing protein [Baekduia sp.]